MRAKAILLLLEALVCFMQEVPSSLTSLLAYQYFLCFYFSFELKPKTEGSFLEGSSSQVKEEKHERTTL